MGKKGRSYKANRAPQARTLEDRYNVYLRWYKHYAKNNPMAEAPLNKFGFKNKLNRATYLGYSKENLAKQIAMHQRLASEKQLRVTWETIQKMKGEFRKKLEFSKKNMEEKVLAEYMAGLTTKKGYGPGQSDLDFTQVIKYVQKWGGKDLPKHVKYLAFKAYKQDIAATEAWLNEYEDIKFSEFRRKQKAIVNEARDIVTDEQGRATWNEAFAEAVSVVYRK